MSADARLRVAQAAETGGDRDLALSMYTAAAASAPSDVPLQLECAEGIARNGNIAAAEEMLDRDLRASPGQPDFLRARGVIYLVSGQPEKAVADFAQILATNPRDVRALVDKGVGLDMTRHHDEAQSAYRQALAIAPEDPAIRNDLALSMMLEGRLREAQAVLAPLADADGSPERLKVNLGILDAANGDVSEARRLLGDRISTDALTAITRAIQNSGASAHGS